MLLKHIPRLALHRLITMRLCARNPYRFPIQLKRIHFLDGLERALVAVKHDKRLALALQRRFGNHVEDGAVVGEYARQRFFHRVDLYALFEVVDL
jgi:hypothetical protein